MLYYNNCNGSNRDYRRNDYNNRGQNSYNSQWENENYGWNYYPETDNRFDSYDNDYQKDNSYFNHNSEEYYCKEDKNDKDCKTCKCHNPHKNCRPFSCFPFIPCFRNNHFDCRENRQDWKGRQDRGCKCPCQDFDCNKRPEQSNKFYFSGCIEFKNNDRKF